MNKIENTVFYKNLVNTNEKIKQDRGIMLAGQAERAKRKIVEDLIDKIENEKFKLERMYDLSPKETTDLAYREDFNPKTWAEETQKIEDNIFALTVKMTTAKKAYEKQFGTLNISVAGGAPDTDIVTDPDKSSDG